MWLQISCESSGLRIGVAQGLILLGHDAVTYPGRMQSSYISLYKFVFSPIIQFLLGFFGELYARHTVVILEQHSMHETILFTFYYNNGLKMIACNRNM
jgi:hypothetical protein